MRFIHTGDIHLGAAPDAGYPWSEKREKEIWTSFQRLIETVKQEKTDLLLIAGDFFHRQPLLRELKEVNYLFSTISDTQVVIIAGNHDYIKADAYYPRFSWAKNVVGLWEDTCQEVYLPKIKTWVYGFSYHTREIVEPRYRALGSNQKPGHHILVAHGGDEKHIPITTEDLRRADFDYIALGHIHRPGMVIADKAAYCGALEPLDRNDIGLHGYIKGIIDEAGVRTEFVESAVCSYIHLNIAVDCHTTQLSLAQQVHVAMQENGSHNLYRITLQGLRDPELMFSGEDLMELGNITNIIDQTRPDYDLGQLGEQYAGSLIGEYIEYFQKREDEPGKKALYYGLHALLEAKR